MGPTVCKIGCPRDPSKALIVIILIIFSPLIIVAKGKLKTLFLILDAVVFILGLILILVKILSK